MRTYSLEKLDAFAGPQSAGNPAAMIRLESAEDIEPAIMQRIALELKGYISEAGFVWPGSDVDFELRYYSSEQEVGFCGHATVAIMHRLISSDPTLMERSELTIRTRDSELKVINRVAEDNLVFIFAPQPGFCSPVPEGSEIAAALGLSLTDCNGNRPPAVVDLGQRILLFALASTEACQSLAPDYHTLREFCLRHQIQIVTVYAITGDGSDLQIQSRVFPPVYGYLEDPATGSGNAALGYHLLRTGQWNGTPLVIHQGPDTTFPNLVHLASSGERVLIGGAAVCRFSGTYYLP